MKKVFHKKKWNAWIVELHVGTPLIPLIKSKNNGKFEDILLKLCWVEIQRQKSRTSLNLKWPCLIMVI